jgi:hypothetical protein
MDDQRVDREGGRSVALCSRTTAVLFIAIGLIVLPFVLIGLAVLEWKSFGTHHLMEFGEGLGITKPLQSLHDALPWLFGK